MEETEAPETAPEPGAAPEPVTSSGGVRMPGFFGPPAEPERDAE